MVVNALARLLEARIEPFARRDAIVVLGARLRSDGSPTPILAERISAAAALYRAGGAPLVIATGGATGSIVAEADAIAESLDPIPVRIERAAQTTADNARLVAAMLPRGASVWLVTQSFHGRRAAYLFRREGLDAHVWHIAGSPRLRWILREYAAWLKTLAGSRSRDRPRRRSSS